MTFFKALVGASLVAYAAAECPNACSGHGTCSKYDMCTCYRNWQASDCSQRTCPFDLAHVDSPKGDLNHDNAVSSSSTTVVSSSTVYPSGTTEQFPKIADTSNNVLTNSAHAYMECSNKGICDRTTGTCECFDGYDGSACQRASCPNDCSGHGTCESISLLATREYGNVYELWDKDATLGCNCDAGFSAADCSSRDCKHGTDPLYSDDNTGNTYIANFLFTADSFKFDLTSTYSIIFYDIFGETYETTALSISADCAAITAALVALPNDAVPSVTCTQSTAVAADATGVTTAGVKLSFSGNPGNIKPMKINEYLDGSRKTVFTTDNSAYTLQEWTSQIGESVDYFATKCSGVTVTPQLTATSGDWITDNTDAKGLAEPGSVGYLDITDTSGGSNGPAILNVCLGDSNGDSSDNVDIYNWDHGAIKGSLGSKWNVGTFPHAVKVQNSAGDSEYLLVWYDAGRGTSYQHRTVNSVSTSLTGALDIYTTSGVVQMLGKDGFERDTTTADVDGVFTAGLNETRLAGYFSQYSNLIYTNFDGSCEGDGTYFSKLHNCVEKGDLLFVVDGCWGWGDKPTDLAAATEDVKTYREFGGNNIADSCGTSTTDINGGTGMLYTVNKIYSKDHTANTTSLYSAGGLGEKGQEDRFVIEVDHNLAWDGSLIGNPDMSTATDTAVVFGEGHTGVVVLFKFTPANDGSSYTYVSECSNRGTCDGETGLCSCFKGYTGDDCATQNSLAV